MWYNFEEKMSCELNGNMGVTESPIKMIVEVEDYSENVLSKFSESWAHLSPKLYPQYGSDSVTFHGKHTLK